MTQSWHSLIGQELDAVDAVIAKIIESTYPELTDTCHNDFDLNYRTARTAFMILAYHAMGIKDAQLVVDSTVALKSALDGLGFHERIGNDGKVIDAKKGLFSKKGSTTKVIVAGDYLYAIGFRYSLVKAPVIMSHSMDVMRTTDEWVFMASDLAYKSDFTMDDCAKYMAQRYGNIFKIIAICATDESGADEAVKTALIDYASNVGTAYGIANDVADLFGEGKSKPTGVTLFAGRLTLPLFYALQDASSGKDIAALYSKGDVTGKDVPAILSLIGKTKAKEESLKVASEYAKKAVEALGPVPESDYKNALLELANDMI